MSLYSPFSRGRMCGQMQRQSSRNRCTYSDAAHDQCCRKSAPVELSWFTTAADWGGAHGDEDRGRPSSLWRAGAPYTLLHPALAVRPLRFRDIIHSAAACREPDRTNRQRRHLGWDRRWMCLPRSSSCPDFSWRLMPSTRQHGPRAIQVHLLGVHQAPFTPGHNVTNRPVDDPLLLQKKRMDRKPGDQNRLT